MASAVPSASNEAPPPAAWHEFAAAPLVPIALAATVGLVLDRYGGLSFEVELLAAVGGVVGWIVARARGSPALPFLWLAFAGIAAAHHHAHRNAFPPDDLGNLVGPEPTLVRVRGVLAEEPTTKLASTRDPLAGTFAKDRDSCVLRATAIETGPRVWSPASGLAALRVDRDTFDKTGPALGGLHAGDLVEIVGQASRPRTASNLGEADYADFLLDRRIRAEIVVSDSDATVTRLDARADRGHAFVAAVRSYGATVLGERLPSQEAAVARALLLGDTAAMDRDEWDSYVRTGTVHVLAISGQHLVVLAGFAWLALRLAGVRRGRGAWVVMLLILGYTVVTGMKPSGVRATVMVAAVCGGLILRRPVRPANAFALAWLAIVAWNPTDPFSLGCRLSFLSVFVLIWAASPWLAPRPRTPLERLIDESRSVPETLIRALARIVFVAYAVTLLIAAANVPLLASDQNLISPVGVLIGPPMVLLTSISLLAGFLLILFAPLGFVAAPFAFATEVSLAAAGWLVQSAERIPGGAVYVPGPPIWWVVGCYLLLGALILGEAAWRPRILGGLAMWILVALLIPPDRPPADELRITFLAVGKGGCAVLETPDGRCLVYDAGTTLGPAAVRRVIAPYLWARGIGRIDELFLSHADADHFNGIAELMRRFRVGTVTMTPSFADKPTAEVATALLAIEKHRVTRRIAVAGDRFSAGDARLDVLHPPPVGPPGTENERSLVIAVRFAGHTVLLTGDLENAGTERLLELPSQPAAVLMAPHHGSEKALSPGLVAWSRPRLVVASRGQTQTNSVKPGHAGLGVPIWDTRDYGAIAIRLHTSGVTTEAFRTGERLVVERGK